MGDGAGPEDGLQRVLALARYDLLSGDPGPQIAALSALVADALDVPCAVVACTGDVGTWRTWPAQACAPTAVLAATAASVDGVVVPDTRADPRFAAVSERVGACAGVPLVTPDGHRVGALHVADAAPRAFTARDLRLLRRFAAVVVDALEARVRERQLVRDREADAAQLRDLRRVAADAETLAAITALFDSGLDPAEATLASAGLLGTAADVDWCGLLSAREGTLDLLASWDRLPQTPTPALDSAAVVRGVSGFATRGQLSAFIDDYAAHPRALPDLLDLHVTSVAALSLGEIDGARYVLVSARRHSLRPWRANDRALLEAAARSVSGALERHSRLRSAQAAAQLDALTGLPNRRAFDEALGACGRHGEDVQVVLVDLDGMKAVNDSEGHERGDALLQVFARALGAQFRAGDGVYRLGGDEFAVLLRGRAGGHLGAEDVLERVDLAVVSTRAASFAHIGASTGIAPSAGRSMAETVAEADRLMYAHKRRKATLRRPAGSDLTPA